MSLFVADPDDLSNPMAGLSFTLLQSNNGSVILDGNTGRFLPDENFFGTTTFQFQATDGQFTETLSGSISLTGVDDAPFLAASEIATDEDTN